MRGLALFDLDDTLCDRAAAFALWARGFSERYGLDEETALPWMVRVDNRGITPRPAFFGMVRDRFGLAPSVDRLVADYPRAHVAGYACDPAVRRGLRGLKETGWTVGIVTNGEHWQRDKILVAGLDEVVDGWAISALEGVAKPDPELFRRAAGACDVALDGGWMVGDNPVADIGGAVLAGLRSVWIDQGRDWEEPAYKPDYVCDGPLPAIDVIMRSSGTGT